MFGLKLSVYDLSWFVIKRLEEPIIQQQQPLFFVPRRKYYLPNLSTIESSNVHVGST